MSLLITPAQAQSSSGGGGPLSGFVTNLVQGLNLIIAFGGFLNARRDENWKMTVIYGVGVAGAGALMKAMFGLFAGTNNSSAYIGQF